MKKVVLPESLLYSLQDVEGFDRESFAEVHQTGEQVVSIRANPLKFQEGNSDIFSEVKKVPWSRFGYYLSSRPSFTLDPLLHAGLYYVQEASSMFLEQCLQQTTDLTKSLRILDLCAAPGGKSTHLQSLINRDSLLVSNEVIRSRVSILNENLSKWGGFNTVITHNDAADFGRLPSYFDVMMVDAPCSGSGLFRRDPETISEWRPEAVAMCSLRQKRILADAYSSLKQGGTLIYSTCSYSAEENEDICDWLCENYDLTSLRCKLNHEWHIIETTAAKTGAKGYRFYPDKLKGEGFFVACFRKNDDHGEIKNIKTRTRLSKVSSSSEKIVDPWLQKHHNTDMFRLADEIFLFPCSMEQDLQLLHTNLYMKKAGVMAGRLAKDQLIPAHELAVSGYASTELLRISLKKDEALQYLRKEEVTLEQHNSTGWALVDYHGQSLGWLKVLKNRANNYYPGEWRILKRGNY